MKKQGMSWLGPVLMVLAAVVCVLIAQWYSTRVVDDGSPDTCPALCDQWTQRDPRIRVVHKENGGLSSARNAGMAVCQGNYISFVDSDDWIEPQMLE